MLAVVGRLGALLPGVPVQQLDANAVSRDPAVVKAYNEGIRWCGTARCPPGWLPAPLLVGESGCPARPRHHTAGAGGARLRGPADPGAWQERMAGEFASDNVRLEIYPGLYHEVFNEPERDQVLDDVVSGSARGFDPDRESAAVALLLAALLGGCGHGKPSSAEYVEEEVTFVADGLTIHGTYRHPAAETPAPAALLILRERHDRSQRGQRGGRPGGQHAPARRNLSGRGVASLR